MKGQRKGQKKRVNAMEMEMATEERVSVSVGGSSKGKLTFDDGASPLDRRGNRPKKIPTEEMGMK